MLAFSSVVSAVFFCLEVGSLAWLTVTDLHSCMALHSCAWNYLHILQGI